MAKTYLNHVFNPEVFIRAWGEAPDPVKTALIETGVLVSDAQIRAAVATDSNLYTIPYYNVLGGTPQNYDGATDITTTETSSDSQSGIVYGRAKAWTARDFVYDLSGNDPMGHIVRSTAAFWAKDEQARRIKILNGVFGITGDTAWAKHSVDAGKISGTTFGDAAVEVLGDQADAFSALFMHSRVANALANLQMLEYAKYTDAQGIQRDNRKIAYTNGMMVIIDDNAPVEEGATAAENEYTTYMLGRGVLRYADAKLDVPVEVDRDPYKFGGQDALITRIRKTVHPNGFTFVPPTASFTQSPTDDQLGAAANWSRKFEAKSIPLAKIVCTL